MSWLLEQRIPAITGEPSYSQQVTVAGTCFGIDGWMQRPTETLQWREEMKPTKVGRVGEQNSPKVETRVKSVQ